MWEQQLKVLVVDDDAGDVELLRRQLSLITEWKSEVHHIADADTAAAQVEHQQPDAVFIDFRLGSKTGVEVVKTLRHLGCLAPILMLTGQGSRSIVKECLISGADDYLEKDMLNPDTLRRGLQHAHSQCLNRKAELKLRFIQFSIDHASDPVLWAREDGRLSYANEAACRMLSCSPSDLLSLRAADIMSSICQDGWQEQWRRIQQQGATTCEDVLRARDGAAIPVELRVNYIRWQNIERACMFVRDLRERKKVEAELREKEEQLRHKQRLEAIGSLAGGIAHEFNNLVQVILGFTQYAMEGLAGDEPRRQNLEQVMNAADRAADLIRQLLGFGRMQVLERSHCDPNEIVTDLAKMLRPLIGEHIELELSLAPDAGLVFADRNLLLQMLLNLCVNARDAMPDGGLLGMATQHVVLDERDSERYSIANPGPHVMFAVTDTGCGMSSTVRDRIFEPFFTTKGIGKGTGLGLAMVYGSVQQHGGAIVLESEVNRGSAFKILLPASSGTAAVPAVREANPGAGGQETALLAENDVMAPDLAAQVLSGAGEMVHLAAAGEHVAPLS